MLHPPRARVAVIGAGPSGIVTAKFGVEAGLDVTVFEASDRLGGQWYTTAPHSGIWPGMHTNTSRAMTAFSDLPPPAEHPLHPAAEQIHRYLEAYARRFGVTERIRFATTVETVTPAKSGWLVNGEPFEAVVLASGRFRKPRLPPGVSAFAGEILHTYDYAGAESFAGRRVLVYGNGISAVEIASDLARVTRVISAFRKSRYVLQKVVDGVSSDWQWYTLFGALERRRLDPVQWSRRQRARVVSVAGDPADFGAPAPDADIRVAGLSLCQDYLAQVRAGEIACRPAIAAVDGHEVIFSDGTREAVEAIICGTGYDIDLPYLAPEIRELLGSDLALYQRTFHPDLPGLAVIGQFLAQGPYFPLLELQARWIVATWTGAAALPGAQSMRQLIAQPRPALDAHNALALTLSEELGVAPDPTAWPELTEPLLFGPMLPARYRLSGPGALPDAPERFTEQLLRSPRAAVDRADVEALRSFGWDGAADAILAALAEDTPLPRG